MSNINTTPCSFICQLMSVLGWLSLFSTMINAAMNICVQFSEFKYVFSSLRNIPCTFVAVLYGNSSFNLKVFIIYLFINYYMCMVGDNFFVCLFLRV